LLEPAEEIISGSKSVGKYDAGDEVPNLISEFNKAFPNGTKRGGVIYDFIYAQSEPQDPVDQIMIDSISDFAQFIDWSKVFEKI